MALFGIYYTCILARSAVRVRAIYGFNIYKRNKTVSFMSAFFYHTYWLVKFVTRGR